MSMRSYTSMELDDDAKLDGTIGIGPTANTPDYPWGLRISLSETELAKLGMDDDPEIGDLLHFAAFAKVTSFSKGDGDMGPHRRVELVITAMSCVESTEFGDDK